MEYFSIREIIIESALFIYKYWAFIIFLIAYILYYLSLERCLDGEELCGNNMKWIYKKLRELIISCELISFLFLSIVFNYSSKLHLIHILIIFALFFLYSHELYFYDHGMYNFVFFVLLFIVNVFIILLFKFLISLFQIENKTIISKLFLILFYYS